MWDSSTGPSGPVVIRSSHEQKKDPETKKAETAWAWHGTQRPTGVAETTVVIGNGCREACSQTDKWLSDSPDSGDQGTAGND